MIHGLQTYSKNGQVKQKASADRPVSSLFYFIYLIFFIILVIKHAYQKHKHKTNELKTDVYILLLWWAVL